MNTMFRCALAAIFTIAVAGFQAPVSAQTPRSFPATALRGVMVFGDLPSITLNGQPTRLAPGSRIRGADNMQVMPSAVAGVKLLVNYTIDLGGNSVKDVWILTPDEAAVRWPRNPTEAQTWTYDPVARVWIKP
jgi:hypothetical protein